MEYGALAHCGLSGFSSAEGLFSTWRYILHGAAINATAEYIDLDRI